MSQTLTIRLEQPVVSVKVLHDPDCMTSDIEPVQSKANSATHISPVAMREAESQKATFLQASQALKIVATKITQYYDDLLAGQKAEIARLSVEIARKILMQKVESGDYRIEYIIKEALENNPSRHDIVVHLNTQDLAQFQKAQQYVGGDDFDGIKFIADPALGLAECVVESPKGITKFLIDENLERISKALTKAQ